MRQTPLDKAITQHLQRKTKKFITLSWLWVRLTTPAGFAVVNLRGYKGFKKAYKWRYIIQIGTVVLCFRRRP